MCVIIQKIDKIDYRVVSQVNQLSFSIRVRSCGVVRLIYFLGYVSPSLIFGFLSITYQLWKTPFQAIQYQHINVFEGICHKT